MPGTMRHPRFVATVQLGHIIGAVITAAPLIALLATGYARFTSLEEKVVNFTTQIRDDMNSLREDVRRVSAESKAETLKVGAESDRRQIVYGGRLNVLEKTTSVQETRMEGMAESIREQRRASSDLSNKMDSIRADISNLRERLSSPRIIR